MSRGYASLIEHRVEALAYVFLTRRQDLEVITLGEMGDLDLLVRLHTEPQEREQIFGVILKGTSRELTEQNASRKLASRMKQKDLKKYAFPVLIVLFTMQGDEGFSAWRSEPVIEGDFPRIRTHGRPSCKRFDKGELDRIVEQVKTWYDRTYDCFVD